MRQGIPIYILALNSDSIGIYPSIPPASQKRIMFLSLILSFFSYKYQRTNKIQNERYFHHRYLSFSFNLSLMIFRTVYRYLTFIRLSFTDDTTYLLSISYLHPYLISLTYLCFLTDIFIVPLECTGLCTLVNRSCHPGETICSPEWHDNNLYFPNNG